MVEDEDEYEVEVEVEVVEDEQLGMFGLMVEEEV